MAGLFHCLLVAAPGERWHADGTLAPMLATAPVMMLGPLLGTAIACGLDLYLTVLLIGISTRLGLAVSLPAGLSGLQSEVVIGTAAGLFTIGFILDKLPYADSVWDAVHTIIRPLAAAALAFLALDAAPLVWRIAVSLISATVALAVHGSKAGARVILNARPHTIRTTGLSLLEETLAVALTIAATTQPYMALLAAATLLLGTLLFTRPLWRAAALGVRATAARLRGFFGSPGWRNAAHLPLRYLPLVRVHDIGTAPSIATRAALRGVRRVGDYRNGWLLIERGGLAFLYRSRFRPRRLDLPTASAARIRNALLTDIVDVEAGRIRFTLFLLKDGPPPTTTLARLLPGSP